MEQIHAVKNIAYALLGWVLSSISLFGGAWLQYFRSQKTDSTADSGGFLLSWYWDVHPVCYLAGCILCIGCFVLIWKKILRGTLRNAMALKKGWAPVWMLLLLLAMAVQLLLYFMGLFLNIEFFDTPKPEWTPAFIFVYLGIILLTVAAEIIRFRRETRQQAS